MEMQTQAQGKTYVLLLGFPCLISISFVIPSNCPLVAERKAPPSPDNLLFLL